MEKLKRLEKYRRKAAARAEAAIRQYEKAILTKHFFERKIKEIKDQKDPQGFRAELDAIRKMLNNCPVGAVKCNLLLNDRK